MMNRLLVVCGNRSTARLAQVGFMSTDKLPASQAPKAKDVTPHNAQFDKPTHTGQAWDQADNRLARFAENEKMINPNVAAHLIAEQPPKSVEEHIAKCDGGHPALGHPLVFINLDKPGTHACGYCGQRFFNPHTTSAEQMSIHHIEC